MIFVNRWLKYPLEIFPSLNGVIKKRGGSSFYDCKFLVEKG